MRIANGAMLLRFHKLSLISAGLLGAGLAQNALAQSTGSEIIEDDMTEVVVSATRVKNVGILGENTAAKSRVSLAGDYLETGFDFEKSFFGYSDARGSGVLEAGPAPAAFRQAAHRSRRCT